jgi:hypothetical protein
MLRLITGSVITLGGLACVIGARIYHLACRPEWTEAQALLSQWPLFLAGFAVAVIGLAITSRA